MAHKFKTQLLVLSGQEVTASSDSLFVNGNQIAGAGGGGWNGEGVTGISITGGESISGRIFLYPTGDGTELVQDGNTIYVSGTPTGFLTGNFYPLRQNPSGYLTSVSGSIGIQGGAVILDGQLLIGASGNNAFQQGDLYGQSGISIISGSGSLGISMTPSYIVPATTITATGYTLTLNDAGKVVQMGNTTGSTVWIPPNSSVPFAQGTTLLIEQTTTGRVYVSGLTAGVTLNSFATGRLLMGQWAQAALRKNSTDTWTLGGGITN